ncbi:glycosyltransferase family 2 protein [Clostridium tarantellae]|uniref:Glycosyltransferase n=1 Tax=Clostridium tarantellae TaxID=39493 RepID=A0A6I1MLR4_9CLOT|nr:glycosyltransferase [Clostridium tarantellae]MPQ43057.1 glycosyltransferase [Clostridium tarantellae]
MKKQLISVIVPIYKVEKYLSQCILSLTNQSYKNLEIILIDDGSPDNCGNICDDFSKLDKRIKVIHKDNEGLAEARNVGLNVAKGEYIGFVDSDDWIHPNMYENLINTALKYKAEIVECKFKKLYKRNIYLKENNYIKKTIEFNNKEALKNHLQGKYLYRAVWNKIYKRELFKNIRFPKGKLAEDLYITYKLFYLSKKTVYLDFEGYYYYIRNNSIMGKKEEKLIVSILQGTKDKHAFICNNVPELKERMDNIYTNTLLKAYAYFSSEKYTGINKYKIKINKELNRKDIKASKICKIALFTYKIWPHLCATLINLLEERKR